MGRDGWIGLGLLAFSGWLYSSLGQIPANPLVPIGPAFYPRFLLLLIVLLSLVLVIQNLLPRQEKKREKAPLGLWLGTYRPTLLTFAVFFLYVLLLPKLGYLLSTLLFVTVLHWLLGGTLWRRLPGSLFLGIATALVTYAIFELYLRVFLPPGTWLR